MSWTAPATDGGSAITKYTVRPFIGTTGQTPTTVTGTPPATRVTVTGLTNGTAYTFTVTATNAMGTGAASAASNAVTPSTPRARSTGVGVSATPTTPSASDTGAVTLGVKFKADVSGKITGIRFYKGTGNTGTHVGEPVVGDRDEAGHRDVHQRDRLRLAAGQLHDAGVDRRRHGYVASYFAPVGHYAADSGYFAASGVDNGLLHDCRTCQRRRRRLRIRQRRSLPEQHFLSTNYWVDVVFATP